MLPLVVRKSGASLQLRSASPDDEGMNVNQAIAATAAFGGIGYTAALMGVGRSNELAQQQGRQVVDLIRSANAPEQVAQRKAGNTGAIGKKLDLYG